MPTDRQRDDVFQAFHALSASCDNFNRDAAVAACEDGIRAFRVILAMLGGPGSDASCTSSSEESASDHDAAFDDEGDYEDSESSDDDFDYADDGGGGYDDADDSDCDDDGDDNVDDSASSSSSSSDEGDLVADYSGNADPSRYCDRCGYSGHTNQYCPTLPEPKRRRL